MITIRKATLADLQTLQQLGTELIISDARFDTLLQPEWEFSEDGKKYLTGRIKGKKGICLVAEDAKEIIGYATGALLPIQTWRPVKRSELDNLYVKEGHRGKGVGTQLLQAFKDWSTRHGVTHLVVEAVATNDDAIAFYRKQGFSLKHVALEMPLHANQQ